MRKRRRTDVGKYSGGLIDVRRRQGQASQTNLANYIFANKCFIEMLTCGNGVVFKALLFVYT